MFTILEGNSIPLTISLKEHLLKSHSTISPGLTHDDMINIALKGLGTHHKYLCENYLHQANLLIKFNANMTKVMAMKRGIERILLSQQAVIAYQYVGESEYLMTHLPTVDYNSHCKFKDTLQVIEHFRPQRNLANGIGNWKQENVLIIGEAPSTIDENPVDTPFVKATSGLWLNHQLDSASIDEKDLYWINAVRANGEFSDPSFIENLQPQAIYALGNIASRWCSTHGFEHEYFPHPSYWRRFRSKEDYPFIISLKQKLQRKIE